LCVLCVLCVCCIRVCCVCVLYPCVCLCVILQEVKDGKKQEDVCRPVF
jgi:hypothetical protein